MHGKAEVSKQKGIAMRNMYPDAEYFEHLDELRKSGEWNAAIAPASLVEAFPGLRADEARAICNDWRAACRERWTHAVAS